jgi:3,2-trans-enoyl-CoA isomerase
MTMLETIDHGKIRELKIARPPANALNPELVRQFTESLLEAGQQAEAVVVSGLPGMFSAGLDVPQLLPFGQEQMISFWSEFSRLLKTIACMPVPTAFALTGHAPAGGIVMALFGDYRVMSRGFKTGLNEVQVGLVVSPPIHGAVVRAVGPVMAERILVAGLIMASEQAQEIGLVDELADDPAAAVTRAIEWCEQHVALPRDAMLITRQMARADLLALFDEKHELGVEKFVDIWFSDSTRSTLTAMVERLSKKS